MSSMALGALTYAPSAVTGVDLNRNAGSLAAFFLGIFAAAAPASAQPPPEVWQSYHDHQRLSEELAALSAAFPNLVTLESVGKSLQNRDIWLVTITNRDLPGNKPKVFFDGAIHGSEVIAAESMLNYINFLVREYSTNPTAKEIVDGWITYVVPMVNPDGVEAGKSSSDYKDARKNAGKVDLNRNFDVNWPPSCGTGAGCTGVSGTCTGGTTCTDTCYQYPGFCQFSERESQIIRSEIMARQPLVYLNAHAGLDFEKLIRPDVQFFDGAGDPERTRHVDIQNCIASFTPFQPAATSIGGEAPLWAYRWLRRESGLLPLSFLLETYSINEISPGFNNPYWWCRYNPPAAADDSVAAWCTAGTVDFCPGGCTPSDTLVSRIEKVKAALIYITLSSTGIRPCPGPATLGVSAPSASNSATAGRNGRSVTKRGSRTRAHR